MINKTPVIILAFANNQDNPLDSLRAECANIERMLKPRWDKQYIEIRKQEQTSANIWSEYTTDYRERTIIFHFGGHTNGGVLQFDGWDGTEQGLADGLAEKFALMPELKLLFLNGCSNYGLVDTFFEKGVKAAIIATSVQIGDTKAKDFAEHFYHSLAKGETLGIAYNSAKSDIKNKYKKVTIADLSETKVKKGLKLRREQGDSFEWGLYYQDEAILDWKLPNKKPTDVYEQKLTEIPFVEENAIIGRDEKLQAIHEKLDTNNAVLLVNGMGGIGKTAVAKVYISLPKYQKAYNHLAWLTVTGEGKHSIRDAFLASDPLIGNLNLHQALAALAKDETYPQKAYALILNELQRKTGRNLLVIDNANDTKAIERQYPILEDLEWKVVLTSRSQLSDSYTTIEIDELPMEDAKLLFPRHFPYDADDTVQDSLVAQIIRQINQHTLLTELIAKSANKAKLSLDNLAEKIESEYYKARELQKRKIDTGESSKWNEEREEYRKARVKEYIEYIFSNMAHLEEVEQTYLRYFSVLPLINHEEDFLYQHFQITPETEDTFYDTLEQLTEKGWIEKNNPKKEVIEEDNQLYRLHPLIQEVIITILPPTTANCLVLIESITQLIRIDQNKDNPVEKIPFLEYGLAISNRIHEKTLSIAHLIDDIAYLYQNLGNYKKAAHYFEKALVIAQYHNDEVAIATSQSNLATVYRDLGRYEEAAELLEIALKSDLKNFGEQHPHVKIIKRNLQAIKKKMLNS
jgi:tetratricopeptide (TPR) repeat protein